MEFFFIYLCSKCILKNRFNRVFNMCMTLNKYNKNNLKVIEIDIFPIYRTKNLNISLSFFQYTFKTCNLFLS